MNPLIGWGLAVVGIALAWLQYGWRGVLMAISVIVFWLLLQFSRALRAMKQAGQRPVGSVDSALMMHSRLAQGMTLMQVIGLSRSLGQRVSQDPESWRWTDAGGTTLTLEMQAGKLVRWQLQRPQSDAAAQAADPAAQDQAGAQSTADGSAPEAGGASDARSR